MEKRFSTAKVVGLGESCISSEDTQEHTPSLQMPPDQYIRFLRETLVKMDEAKAASTIDEDVEDIEVWLEAYQLQQAREKREQERSGIPPDLFTQKPRRTKTSGANALDLDFDEE